MFNVEFLGKFPYVWTRTKFPFYGLLCVKSGHRAPIRPPGCPARSEEALVAAPDLHLNVWETRHVVGEKSILDVGMKLDVDEAAQFIDFWLPWSIERSDLIDLSDHVCRKGAGPAIFNESWEATNNGGTGKVLDENNKIIFTVINVHDDLKLLTREFDRRNLTFVRLEIAELAKKSLESAPGVWTMYVRFRVKNVPAHFYRVGLDPLDRFLLSSWERTEIIDFRLNVKRGITQRFAAAIGEFVEFGKVHLFLMKSRQQDLVFEDDLFKACRSLEDEAFWGEYSLPTDAGLIRKWLSRRDVRKSLGYHWSSKKKAAPAVLEFSILGRYKRVKFGILNFLLWVVVFGAMGNVLWDAVKLRYQNEPWAKSLVSLVEGSPSSDALNGERRGK